MVVQPSVVLRADGGPGIGVGHLARCLALAQGWTARGGTATLVARRIPGEWAVRFEAAGCLLGEAGTSPGTADWRVVDGYDLADSDAPGAGRLLRIDDHGLSGAGAADLVLDQNLGSGASTYPWAPAALTGPRYALLRRGLAQQASTASPALDGPLLVSIGGAPSTAVRDFTEAVLAALPPEDEPAGTIRSWSDPGEAMTRASVAFAAAGTTCWELCLFGVPMVLVAVADNQVGVAEGLAAAGAASYVGRVPGVAPEVAAAAIVALTRDAARREGMARRGRELVDGHGAARVVTRMWSDLLRLRRAGVDDTELVYGWSNDPGTREASFSAAPIPWVDHVAWMSRRLAAPDAEQLIASDPSGADVGLVRFDLAGHRAEIGVVVAPERRGQGWGSALIDAGCRYVAAERGIWEVAARVMPDNEASTRAFVDADFDLGPERERRVDALQYTRRFDGQLPSP